VPQEGDADGLGWEETAETFSMRIDKVFVEKFISETFFATHLGKEC